MALSSVASNQATLTVGVPEGCSWQENCRRSSPYRGLKDVRVRMILALIAYWPIRFFLAWALAFPLGLGGIGIWLGFLIGLFTAALMLCASFYILMRREV